MVDLQFNIEEAEHKPKRHRAKGSKYDRIIDTFCEGTNAIVCVGVTGKKASYLRSQLKKRIEARGLEQKVEASTINNVVYLERK